MWIFSKILRRRKEPDIARVGDELSKELETKYDPCGVICLIIMRLAEMFLEGLRKKILTFGEADRAEREIPVWIAVVTFYAHLMVALVAKHLTAHQLDYLQNYITTVASNAAVSFYYPSCSEGTRQELTNGVTKTLNEGIAEYYVVGANGLGKDGSETELFGLLSRHAGSEVAKSLGRSNDVATFKVIYDLLFVGYFMIEESLRLDELLQEIRASLPG